ncbi:tape measure protein [Pseudomonas sp. DSP3-2-2]|uniref:tape measure protein n=1 Tax=unclassified Pseudomonas TaxID=196821 RepID=UPI003CFAFD03
MSGQEVQGMLIRLEATTAQLRQEMDKADASVTKATGRIDSQLSKVDSAFDRVGKSAQTASNVLKSAFALAVGGSGAGALLAQAEAYTTVANRLKLVTSSSAEFTAAQNAVFAIAQRSGQPLGATAELYQRIAQNQDALKLSGKGVAGIVETISKTMVISGASAESANAALIQLGQAFASGTLRGEELNSVMEQAPALSQAIAKGMGVSVGALRALGAEGKLTADSVVKALQAQQGAVDALFGKMQSTVGTALTRIQTSFTKIIGEADAFSGTTSSMADSINNVSKALNAINVPAAMAALEEHGRTLAEILGVVLIAALGRVAAGFAEAGVKAAGNIVTWVQLTAVTRAAAAAKIEETAASASLSAAHVAEAAGNVAVARATEEGTIAKLRLLQGQRDQLAYTAALSVGTAEQAMYTKALAATDLELAAAKRAAQVSSVQLGTALNVESAAMAKDTAATQAATAAKAEFAAISSTAGRAGGALLGMLGGPVGLLFTVAALGASYLALSSHTDTATNALIDQNATVDQSIQKFNELGASQRRFQSIKWAEEQITATESASASLNKYSADGAEAFLQIGYDANHYRAKFGEMIEEVRKGQRTLDSVTEWARKDAGLTDDKIKKLAESSSAYEETSKKAGDLGKILATVNTANVAATSSTERLTVAQQASGQSDASKAAWDKYIEQLTKTRDLLGANAAAEAAYTVAKMGATPAQAAQAKLIADQTDTLKKYQEAIKEGNKVEQASLKLKLVALYAAEDATAQTAAAQKTSLDEAAKATENSATRQVAALQRIIDQTVRVATGTDMPRQNLSGYGLLTNGGTAPTPPSAPVVTKASPVDRATAAIAQLDATTEANKRVDKAANAAATALKNQAKALDDLLAKSGISTQSANEMAAAYLSGADNVRAITIQQQIEEELLKTGAGARNKVTAAINALHDAEDRRDVSKNIKELKTEVDGILKQATATLQGKDALETYNIEKSVTVALAGKNIAVGSEEYKLLVATTKAQLDANKALEQAGQVEGIVDRLSPQTKLLKDFTAEQDALNAAIARYPANAALYQDALAKLGNEYQVNQSKATIWGQMTEGAVDRIDSVFADAWANIGDGAGDLLDKLEKGFKQTLGEIAHMLTTKPLLASISNWLTGTDNGQGLSSVWGKLLGTVGGSSSGSGSSGGMGTMIDLGKNLYSAWNAITGVGSSIASGYATGGVSGAVSGGVGYYGNMINGLSSTLSSGFTSLVNTITGTAAAQTLATIGAEGVTTSVLSGAVAEGATAIGAQFTTGVATTTAATYAAAEAGAAATAASLSGQAAAALSSAAAMWPLAVIMGMYQSGKLYDAGVRPDAGEVRDSAGSTALGNIAMTPGVLQAGFLEGVDKVLGKVVGGKWAAILSGSTFHQMVWTAVGSKLFGSGYETKDTGIQLGVENGEFDAKKYTKQKKKGGLISGSSKTRFLIDELDDETLGTLGSKYNDVVLSAGGLFTALGVKLNDSVLDGLNMASRNISTKDATPEWIQEQLDFFFAQLGDAAVVSISKATDAGLSGFSYVGLQAFVKNLQDVNGILAHLDVGLYDMSVSGGFMAEQLSLWAGGIEALSTAGAAYYDAFFTDIEKSNDTLSDVRNAFGALDIALPDSAKGFREMVSGIDKTTESGRQLLLTVLNMSSAADAAYKIIEARQATYFTGFYSESENAARSLVAVTQEFKDVSIALPETRAAYREMVEAAKKDSSAAGQALYETLMSLNGEAASAYDILETKAKSAAEATKALADTLSSNVSAAMSAVERAVSAEQKALTASYNARATSLNDMLQTAQTRVSDLTSVSDSLESALKSLNGTSADAVKMLRAQALATLQSALATVRAGGSLAGMIGLDDALDVVNANTTDLYSSMDDFARDQGRTANVVAELSAVNGVQLTTEQQLLKTVQAQISDAKLEYDAEMARIDAQLDLAQAQVDKLNGIDTSVLSVKDAIAGLGAAIAAAMAATAPTAGAASGYTGSGGAPSVSDLNSVYNSVLGRDVDPTGAAYWAAQLGSGAVTPAGLPAAIKADAAKNGEIPAYATGGMISGPGTGTSDSILARLSAGEFVMNAAAVRAYGPGLLAQMNALQLPSFADGGAPELRYESPTPYSTSSSSSSDEEGGSREEILAALNALTAEVKEMKPYLRQTTLNTGRAETHLDAIRTVGIKAME